MDFIKITDAKDVQKLYKDNNVNEERTKNVNEKFVTVPDTFKVYGLCFPTLTINGEEIPNVPALAINQEGTKYVTVGTFRQAWTDKEKASKITKEGSPHKGDYLVVNNRRVHAFSVGLSEAELVAFMQDKEFVAEPSKDYQVFQPKYVNRKPVYGGTEAEALAMVKPKLYREVKVKGE